MLDNDKDDTCDESYNWIQPRDKDLRVQTALSLILGISALVTFCVSVETSSRRSCGCWLTPLCMTDSSPAMAETLRRTQTEDGPQTRPAVPTEYVLWVDA